MTEILELLTSGFRNSSDMGIGLFSQNISIGKHGISNLYFVSQFPHMPFLPCKGNGLISYMCIDRKT